MTDSVQVEQIASSPEITTATLRSWLQRLDVARLRVRWRVDRALELPAFAGSVLRGAFGLRLRQSACLTGAPSCSGCPLRARCSYGLLFETAPPADAQRLRRASSVPHPMLLRPPAGGHHAPGSELSAELLLFGSAIEHAGTALAALIASVAGGLGADRVAGDLRAVEAFDVSAGVWISAAGSVLPRYRLGLTAPAEGSGRLHFETPLRLLREGVELRAPSAGDLLLGLIRRASLLVHFFGDAGPEPDFTALAATFREVAFERSELRWYNGSRFSARQRKSVPLSGLQGDCVLPAAFARHYWPLLAAGSELHVGKAAVMGMGRYRLD